MPVNSLEILSLARSEDTIEKRSQKSVSSEWSCKNQLSQGKTRDKSATQSGQSSQLADREHQLQRGSTISKKDNNKWQTKRRSRSGPLRICFVIDQLQLAGTETQLLALIENLNRAQIIPYLCLLNGNDPNSQKLEPKNCEVLRLGLTKLKSFAALVAAKNLIQFWRKHRIDIVQCYFRDSSYFAIPLAKLSRVPHTIRVINNLGYWQNKKGSLIERVIQRGADRILTNSRLGQVWLSRKDRIPLDRVGVIANGVDLERFANLPPPNVHGKVIRIGVIANLRPVKNIDGLIRVAQMLIKRYPQLRFEVAGTGELKLPLDRLIFEQGLTREFHLIGPVTDIPGFLARQDIAVLPSHSEGMSNALLEYMAAGRAIVATEVGANSELIRNGLDGLLVPPGNDTALALGLERLLISPGLAIELGKSARIRVEKNFSRQKMIQQFQKFYESLLK